MKIHSLSTLIAVPFIAWTCKVLYDMFYNSGSVGVAEVLIPTVALVVIYLSHPQMDFWWLKRNTPPLDSKMKEWLVKYSPYYNHIDSNQKALFEKRLFLYVEGREFKSVGSKELREVPYDIKAIISSQAVKMLLGREDFLLKDMDRIYMYKHPFPSPKFQFLHSVEPNLEDGVIIFSLEQGLSGIVNPIQHYNVVLHGYAKSFIENHPSIKFPDVDHYGWTRLELINGIFSERILKTLGFEAIDLLTVHIVAFFDFSDQYEKLFPEEFRAFSIIFNQTPPLNISTI